MQLLKQIEKFKDYLMSEEYETLKSIIEDFEMDLKDKIETIEIMLKESNKYVEHYESVFNTTRDKIRDWDSDESNASYDVGFYDAVNLILRLLKGRELHTIKKE